VVISKEVVIAIVLSENDAPLLFWSQHWKKRRKRYGLRWIRVQWSELVILYCKYICTYENFHNVYALESQDDKSTVDSNIGLKW